MKNPNAIKLVAAANKYRKSLGHFAHIQQDYEDLMSIAQMIENNENAAAICKAMWKLDTAVRDVIPDKVYYTYNE